MVGCLEVIFMKIPLVGTFMRVKGKALQNLGSIQFDLLCFGLTLPKRTVRALSTSPPQLPPSSSPPRQPLSFSDHHHPRPPPYTCGHMHRGRHNQRIGSPYALHTRLGPIIISLTTAAPTGWAHSHLTFYPTGFGVTCAVLAIDSWSWPTVCKWL